MLTMRNTYQHHQKKHLSVSEALFTIEGMTAMGALSDVDHDRCQQLLHSKQSLIVTGPCDEMSGLFARLLFASG